MEDKTYYACSEPCSELFIYKTAVLVTFNMDKLSALIVFLGVAIACTAGALLFVASEEFEIKYDLDGGELSDNAPTKYKPGNVIELPTATKEGFFFMGWILNEDDEDYFSGDTKGLRGSITLIAVYSQNLNGCWERFNLSGSYRDWFNSYTIGGQQTFKHMYYDVERGEYYMHSDFTKIYTYYNGITRTISNSYEYWPTEVDWEVTGEWTETIETIDGVKECNVTELTYGDGSVQTVWSSDDVWYEYKLVYVEKDRYGNKISTNTYTLKDYGSDEMPKDCTVDVVAENGITVSGNESPYTLGDIATLTATVGSGTTFAGWYDANMNLLSKNLTYKFTVVGDMTIYALNNQSDDVTFSSDTPVNLDIEDIFSDDAVFTITNTDTLESETVTNETYTFQNGGPYRITVTDTNGVHKIYSVKVTGLADRVFEWKFNGKTYNVTLGIDYDDLLKARSLYTVSERAYSSNTSHNTSFVTYAYEKDFMAPYMDQLVELVHTAMVGKSDTVNDSNVVNCLLRFVQYIEYETDLDTMGADEYWKFPLETLYDQGGDCEDTSILFAAMAHVFKEKYGMTYHCGFEVIPQHAIAIVKLSGSGSYQTNPSGWLYCETTAKDSSATDAGEIPPKMTVYSSKYGTQYVKEFFTNSKYYSDKTSEMFAID